jgi:3-methyladenine DNA glycosylase Tag
MVRRCAQAVIGIDNYLLRQQKSGAYNTWLERYTKNPSEYDDTFLFGKLVQAMFSGGMKGQVVDAWMPRMQRAFHEWDMHSIARLSNADLEQLARSGS